MIPPVSILITMLWIATTFLALFTSTSLANKNILNKKPGVPTYIGKFPFKDAAFTSLFPRPSSKYSSSLNYKNLTSKTENGTGGYDLILSAFGIFSSEVAIVPDVGSMIDKLEQIVPKSITTSMKWPNGVAGVPENVLHNSTRYIVIPDGFLVPTKGDGSVTIQPIGGGSGHVISSGDGDWFYHKVQWADMDKDGRLDALTCRANKPIIGSTQSQMVFFSNPKDHSLASPWKNHVIASGPDVEFELTNLTVVDHPQPFEVVITTEYFTPRVRIFWTVSPNQNWSDADSIKYRDIDQVTKDMGNPFDVLVADLDLDGKVEIVVTFNQNKNGSVVLYEIPDDFRLGAFKRHVLASGYAADVSGPNTGAPGTVHLLPAVSKLKKPSILVAGDDSGRLTIFQPSDSTGPGNWSYDATDFLFTEKSTIGALSIADVDGDGTLEIFAPSYEKGMVYVFRA